MSTWFRNVLTVVVGILVIVFAVGWMVKGYVESNYVAKPEPYEARSVLYGMGVRESFYNLSINAYQKRDTAQMSAIVRGLTAVVDSLKKEIGQ